MKGRIYNTSKNRIEKRIPTAALDALYLKALNRQYHGCHDVALCKAFMRLNAEYYGRANVFFSRW